jgi:hypothetical protein
MKVCILKSDQEEFIQLMEMYNIQIEIVDSIVYAPKRNFTSIDNDVEFIYLCKMQPNQKNQYFNWFELGQMFERNKFKGVVDRVNKMKKKYESKLNIQNENV